jgi:hypothetical protein
MTECTLLSDRMVDVAHGRSGWTADDEAHMVACPDCTAEWALVQHGARLGTAVGDGLAADHVATRVLAELRRPAPARVPWLRRHWQWLALPIAAALALMVWQGPAVGPGDDAGVTVAVSPELLPELELLDASELETLFDLLPASEGPVGDIGGLGDLDEGELQAILHSMEG